MSFKNKINFVVILVGLIVAFWWWIFYKTSKVVVEKKSSIVSQWVNNAPEYVELIQKINKKYYTDSFFSNCSKKWFESCLNKYHYKDKLEWNFLTVLNSLSKKPYDEEFYVCIWNTIYSCYNESVSEKTKTWDLKICNDYFEVSARDNCFSQIVPKQSIEKKDISICDNFNTKYLQDDCKNNYYITFGLCEKISDMWLQTECEKNKYMKLAIDTNNIMFCDKISNENFMMECKENLISKLAIANNNIEYCSKIPASKNVCISKFLAETIISKAKTSWDCQQINNYKKFFLTTESYESILNSCITKIKATKSVFWTWGVLTWSLWE